MSEYTPRSHEFPSPRQISSLAAVALGTARTLDKIITPSFAGGKSRFFCDRRDMGRYSDEFDRHVVGFMVSRNRPGIREADDYISRESELPLLRFRIKDTYFSDPDKNKGIRHEYYFAWDKDQVYRSTKETLLLPHSIDDVSMQGLYNWLRNNQLNIGMLDEEMNAKQFYSNEFEDMAEDMRLYFESLKIR